jgi:hypothetical protein
MFHLRNAAMDYRMADGSFMPAKFWFNATASAFPDIRDNAKEATRYNEADAWRIAREEGLAIYSRL